MDQQTTPARPAIPADAGRPRVPMQRLLLLLLAATAVLSGLDAALLRLGLGAPVEAVSLAAGHGVLMVYGFLGTAITLERAVALQSGPSRSTVWAYAAPSSGTDPTAGRPRARG